MPRQRKKGNIKPLKTLRIYCEGDKTEPNYINGYIRSLPSQARKSVISVEPTNKNTPAQLVDVALDVKNSRETLPEDEFWVVYDRESPAEYSDALHASAMSKADSNGIKVALSNVCFEYWLLLHFVETTAPFESCMDLRKNSDLIKEVRAKCGFDYEKSSQSLFTSIQGYIPVARKRGAKLNQTGLDAAEFGKKQQYKINPYVGMVLLLDAIDQFDLD